jgi:tetratricopeptide (TPR) repeat protein
MSGPLYAFLAASLGQQGSFDEAETLFRKAIALNERFDVSGREAAIANAGLSRLFTMQTEYELAEPPSRRALSLLEQMHGNDHPDTALARADLAVTLARLNRDAEAHELFARALGVLESSFGPVSSKLLRPLHDWINALIAAGKYEQAAPYQEQVAKIEGVAQPVD